MQRPHFERPEPPYEPEPHEFWDMWRDQYVVAREYAFRPVIDSFLTPAGDVLLLCHADSGSDPWAVAKLDADQGHYFADEDRARAFYWRRVAESFGSDFLTDDSVQLRYGTRQRITELIAEMKDSQADSTELVTLLEKLGVPIEERPALTVRCSTIRGTDEDGTCTGLATQTLDYSLRDPETGDREPQSDPVCLPCGESYLRRPALMATMRPLEAEPPVL